MGVGIGEQSWIGFAEESTWGTAATVTRFLELLDGSGESLNLKNNIIKSKGMRPGYHTETGANRVVSSRSAGGSFKFEVKTNGMGMLLKHIMGGNAAPVQQGATIAYLQTHALNRLQQGKGLTVQKQIGDAAGGVIGTFTYPGSRITKAEFTTSVDNFLECSIEIDSKDEDKTIAAATPSYLSGTPFQFKQAVVKLAGSPVTTPIISNVSVAIERKLATDRRGIGNNGYKSEQYEDGRPKVTGKLSSEFTDLTTFYDRFSTDAGVALVIEYTGANIAGSYNQLFRITLPEIHFTGDSPNVKDAGGVAIDVPFEAQWDGASADMTIEYISTDTAI